MNIKKTIFILLIIFSLFLLVNLGDSKDLAAGISDLPNKNKIIDIVKAIDEIYTEGNIKFIFYPAIDLLQNVEYEKVDFHIPGTVDPDILFERKPVQHSTEKIGKVAMVIYSNINKKITKKMLNDAYNKDSFPYKIDTSIEFCYNTPFDVVADPKKLDQSMKKLNNKRIDAVIWSQEEGDYIIQKLKMKSIYREHWKDFKDIMIVTNTPRGDEINKILSSAIKKLNKSGKLNQLYSKLHSPYKEWQPSKMSW